MQSQLDLWRNSYGSDKHYRNDAVDASLLTTCVFLSYPCSVHQEVEVNTVLNHYERSHEAIAKISPMTTCGYVTPKFYGLTSVDPFRTDVPTWFAAECVGEALWGGIRYCQDVEAARFFFLDQFQTWKASSCFGDYGVHMVFICVSLVESLS